jgi:hypothetical protein
MKKYIISSLILLGCSLHAVESRIEIRNREDGGVGYNMGYTSLDYFLMAGENVEYLLDLRGHVFNNGQAAGNAGFGVRCPVKDDKFLIGGNVFYDLRQSTDLFCNQVGAGFEWLTKNFDFRANGYLPFGKKKHFETKTFDRFASKSVLIRRKLKATLPSIDAEVGTPLPRPFYFAVGSYYLFKEEEHSLEVGGALGARVRADVDLGRYVTLGLSVTYDHIFKTRVQGIISINIPFGKRKCLKPKKKNDCYPVSKPRNLRRVPIMRNEIIPIQERKKSKDPLLLATEDDPVKFLFVNNMATVPGDGSFEKPFASLKEAEKNSDPGDVIYVFAGDKTTRNMDQGIVLKKDQILASSGAPLVVGDIAIPAQTPDKPIITNMNIIDNPNEPFITNPGKTRIHDFFVIPPWDVIFGRGYSDVGNVDPHADARDIGFEPVLPDAAPPAGPVIFDNYLEPAPAQIADDWVHV